MKRPSKFFTPLSHIILHAEIVFSLFVLAILFLDASDSREQYINSVSTGYILLGFCILTAISAAVSFAVSSGVPKSLLDTLLPHILLVLNLTLTTLVITNLFNRSMGFVTSDMSKLLTLSVAIFGFSNSLSALGNMTREQNKSEEERINMRYRAVVFDMDGTLLDTEMLAAKAFDYAGEKMGIGPAGYINERILGLTVEAARPFWIEEFGDGYDEEKLLYYKREFVEDYIEKNGVPVKKGMHDILYGLKASGYKLAIASSTREATVKSRLTDVGVYDLFDVIVTGDMVKASKPEPDIFALAAKRLGVKPSDAIAVEDGKNGIISAHTAGYGAVIMVPDLWQPTVGIKKIVTKICPDLSEALHYIEKELK